jgi:hypothetical protein
LSGIAHLRAVIVVHVQFEMLPFITALSNKAGKS